ncbi:MAG: hypothetical protein QOE55_7090 [Acidobacteriaceae bacterium]|jgi:uncharacterized protein|nr:hypothetical protein [Acidobacteriaceae bacterium]
MKRHHWKVAQAAVLASTLLLIFARARAQSFDCNKASTPVEHAICNDKTLGELDTTLASQLKDSMSNANPGQHADFLRDERQWLSFRNQHCAASSPTAGESLPECLAAVYRDRIAYFKSLKGAETANCQKIADRYRPLVGAHLGESPLSVLAATPASGVTLTEPLIRMVDPKSALPQWANKQTPPFIVPDGLTQSLMSMSIWTLERLPDANFYWLSSIAGTAHCYDSQYFVISNGRAEEQMAPPGFEDGEGAACGVSREFGRIDAASVFLEENYDWTPRMSSGITVATWKDGGFRSTCTVAFSFAPKFSDQTLNSWDKLEPESWKACAGPICADLRRAAFDLVAAVQSDPIQAQHKLRSTLSAAQLVEYETAVKLATHDQPGSGWDQKANVDPANITEEDPLLLPYVDHGRVFLASLGHFTIGWRYFADWGVTFKALDGKLTPQAHFAVGMIKGEPEKVLISAVH